MSLPPNFKVESLVSKNTILDFLECWSQRYFILAGQTPPATNNRPTAATVAATQCQSWHVLSSFGSQKFEEFGNLEKWKMSKPLAIFKPLLKNRSVTNHFV